MRALAQLRHGLRVETEWNPKVGFEAAQGSAKMWRGNADNQVAFPAETYHPANDMLVGAEFRLQSESEITTTADWFSSFAKPLPNGGSAPTTEK